MIDPGTGAVISIVVLFVLIFIRTPLFLALGFAGILGLYLIRGDQGLQTLPLALTAQLANFTLVAVPLYILIGETLSVTGLGRDLFKTSYKWMSRLPGSLGVASVASCATFGAMSGVSLSGVAVVGRMAVPAMLERGYKPAFATGSVVAPGALAMLIPPSLMFILYSAVTGTSVAALFAGGIVPGILLAVLMAGYIIVVATIRPENAPRTDERYTWAEKLTSLRNVIPAILLIVCILGAIYTGFATPTEAAAVGALAAFLIAGLVYRALSWENLKRILFSTVQVSCAVLAIVASAFVFTKVLVLARVPSTVAEFVGGLDLPAFVVMAAIMVVLVALGCMVDAASLLLVVTPVLVPVVAELGYDPLWFGVLLVMNLELAVITPPVGLNLFAMKSVMPEIPLSSIMRGVIPYIIIEFGLLMVMLVVPEIATWLPSVIVG
ncbi:TRAP transporter large permease [Serinicoccus marinus]|uniref:TRAP transporter large permease n=1 Tax=Serinicoccus marinus TaxID=247333 RepID=UPI002492CA9D|nr:TRAP transporter large permease [Serinicoccus marinus]